MNKEDSTEVEYKTKIRNINILNYYIPLCNDIFKNDGIDYLTQKEFNIGYDDFSNRITIPIFNELGNLIGVKGRRFDFSECCNSELDQCSEKYIYLERCNKSHILYGLNMTYNDIIRCGRVYVGESEKFVMQLWSHGIYNTVAIGSHKISKYQLVLLQRLGVEICICFDKDIPYKSPNNDGDDIYTECSKFESWADIYYMIDKLNILEEKESPSDNIKNFKKLEKECIYSF